MSKNDKRNLRVSYKSERGKKKADKVAFTLDCISSKTWLRAAGFEIGDQVVILVEQGKVTITKA